MTIPEKLLRTFTEHWKIAGLSGSLAMLAAIFRWFYPTRKDWLEAKASKAKQLQIEKDLAIDPSVLDALQNRGLWKGPRAMTGGGHLCVRSAEIAAALSLENEVEIASLQRLQGQGRVENMGGKTYANPVPYWIRVW